MALFPQMSFTAGGLDERTHTNLVKSEGMSPAEKWILDPDLPGLFEYRFGGFGNVVIPKAKILAVTTAKYDWETEKIVNCLTIANGTNTPIGVAPYNFYEKKRDRMGDNQLSIINREYIELPFITGSAIRDMKWGCAYGANATALQAGDFVKPDARGNFVKWNVNSVVTEVARATDAATAYYLQQAIKPGTTPTVTTATGAAVVTTITVDSYAGGIIKSSEALTIDMTIHYVGAASDPIEQMVGQILAVETDLPPLGWLAYFINMETVQNEYTEAIRQASYAPATANGYPGTADWAAMVKQAFSPGTGDVSGIKFLTDGYFRAKTTHGTTDTPVLIGTVLTGSAIATTGCSIDANSVITVADSNENHMILTFSAPIAADDAVNVFLDATLQREGSFYHIDYNTNQIHLYPASAANGSVVSIAITLIENQVPGLPTEWDYQGSVGAVRVLLSK